MNFKLRGQSHKVVPHGIPNEKGFCGATPGTIIMGADVTHPKEGLENCPSMAGVVATIDDESSQYLGSARLQKGKQEVRTHQATKPLSH